LDPARPVSGVTTATSIVAGDQHECARLEDRTVWCWGVGDSGQRGDGNFNTAQPNPVEVVGGSGTPLTGASAITTRGYHTCALLVDGTVQCWGQNDNGQLGDGGPLPGRSSNPPARVSGLSGVLAVTGGFRHTCALLGDHTVWCWGLNDSGQLGDGTTTSSSTPLQVGGITSAVAVSAGVSHTCALLSGGAVKCWGWNNAGQLGNGTTTNASTPVTMTGTGGTAVTWASSDQTIATIDATGLATADQKAGTTTITATDGSGATASTTLTVRQ